MSSRKSLTDALDEALRRAIPALATFLVAIFVSFVVDVPLWSRGAAALLALAAAVLVYLWLPSPRAWKRGRGWRFGVVGALAAGAILALAAGIASQASAPMANHSAHASLILFDTSAAMLEPLIDGKSKREAAIEILSSQLQGRETHQLGLATFGAGDCDARPAAQMEVTISKGRTDRIETAVDEGDFTGIRNLVSAGRWALGPLADFTNTRQLIVIAGGFDECGFDYEDLETQAAAIEAALEVNLIGLGWSQVEKEDFRETHGNTRVHRRNHRGSSGCVEYGPGTL